MTKNSDPSGSVTASGHPAKCFVMQPFGKKQDPRSHKLVDNDKVYESIKAIERIRPTFPIHLFRANTEQYKGEDLHKHVLDSVNTSDFCVSDFTGQNVNVFYETGYARGTGKPIVVICQSRDDVPTDLKGLLTVPYRMDELHGLARDIDQHLNWVKVDVEGQRERTSASVKYFSTRGEADVGARIRAAKHRIDILQTNLATVQVSFLPDILACMRDNVDLQIRILTLNPQSIFVNYRGEQLGFGQNIALFRGECEAHLRGVHYPLLEFGKRARIRLYDDFPTQIAFAFDHEILACVVSVTGRSRENCAFLLNVNTPGAKQSFVEHFERLWNDRSALYEAVQG